MPLSSPARAFRQYVFKIHSRCNIACDYCYVYEHADQSWRSRPTVASDATIDRFAARVGEHAAAHGLGSVRVVLHGGEPLLAGPVKLTRVARRLRAELPPDTRLDLRMQTNGVRLADSEQLCRLLVEEGIKAGVSLDGGREANDRHRTYRNGAGSYEKVARAIRRLGAPRNRESFAGILCTIDLANDPVAVYEALAALDPPRIDFLLPHATWDTPPPRPPGAPAAGVPVPGASAPYADWLIRVFERWREDGCLTPVRVFDSILSALGGGASLTEALGTEPSDLAVVETDGAIEQADSLKIAYDGAPATGCTVFEHSFDDAYRHAGFAARRAGIDGLSALCRACEVVDVCGGGLYAHRYGRGNGFDNPSVYCADLLELIRHVGASRRAAAAVLEPSVPHTFAPDHFDALAAGYGDADAMAALRAVGESRNRDLILSVLERARRAGAHSRQTWEAVDAVESAAPEAFRTVLMHPYVRVWAERALTGLAAAPPDVRVLGRLRAIALAAAARGGVELELDVAVHGDTLSLPTLGSYTLDGDAAEVTVRVSGGQVGLSRPARRRRRRILGEGGLVTALEDADPYRDCHRWPIADTLPEADVRAWRRRFRQAWRLIEQEHADYAPALRAGLQTVVPLARPAEGLISATSRQAFGSVAIALPDSAQDLALLLIHEFQHTKLWALMEMFELFDPADRCRFEVPWRPDKRPVEAVLQGVYAHAAVVEVWHDRWSRGAPGPAAAAAGAAFVFWREGLARVLEDLLDSGALRPLGTRLIEPLAQRVADWVREPVPAPIRAAARTLHAWPVKED